MPVLQSSYERGRSYKKWQDVMNTMPDDKQLAISAALQWSDAMEGFWLIYNRFGKVENVPSK